MILLYVLFVVYILAINFYAFLLVKSLKEKERAAEISQMEQQSRPFPTQTSSNAMPTSAPSSTNERPYDKIMGRLFITGALGGAITIYVCMFLYKYKLSELLLMVLMPMIGILNIYFWVLMFKSGLRFFIFR